MKILVLTDAFWPDQTGGISKSLLTEVEGLVAQGHSVVVVTRQLKKALPLHEVREGYELYRYPSPSKGTVFYRLYPLFSITQIPKAVGRLHGESHFNVAYVHNTFDAAKGKYGLATPLVKVVNHWIKAKERQALTQAHAIIVRSKFMEEEMRKLYGEVGKGKTIRIPLCVDTQRFSFVENPRAIREELGLPLNRPILLTVRRLVARMGLENLVTAMSYVIKKVPDVLLLIGGKGYLENYLHNQVKELSLDSNVKFLGFIPEEKLPKYYQAADLFILPTMALEGFGLATIEALSCGRPVIATPVGANPEVLEPLGEEFLCQDTTPEALAERIVWFIGQGINAGLRRRCRNYCETNFSITKVVSSIEEVLEAVSEEQNGSD